ncbi:MAG: hypothetical protein SP1CHLAM54_17590 [Chlamydiia bacterium]|nr:hypothetical protein [Chlamydiia bacterium]MCH9616647.1 hypothetical protein [Chlamydiia bacterium]
MGCYEGVRANEMTLQPMGNTNMSTQVVAKVAPPAAVPGHAVHDARTKDGVLSTTVSDTQQAKKQRTKKRVI